MNEFSLSKTREKVLCKSIEDERGNEYAIDPDFRTILKCIRVLSDPDISNRDALYLLMVWFFKGQMVENAVELFAQFIGGENGDENGYSAPVMDFEQDADAIYASFMSEYGIDLLDVQEMHWAKFKVLLSGLSAKSALSSRMQLRELDTSKLKGKDKAKAERAKKRVALKERISAQEMEIQRELEEALQTGRDPSPILQRLKNMGGD